MYTFMKGGNHEGIPPYTFMVATTLYTTLYIPPYTFIVATTDELTSG